VTQPEICDFVANGLIRLLHTILCWDENSPNREVLPMVYVPPFRHSPDLEGLTLPRGVARKIFWTHLFPLLEKEGKFEANRPILYPQSRGMLIEIVFALIENDSDQFLSLLEDLDELVPVYPDEDGNVLFIVLLETEH
jgi:ubiquitin carboxyl-terminal hydrolase 34